METPRYNEQAKAMMSELYIDTAIKEGVAQELGFDPEQVTSDEQKAKVYAALLQASRVLSARGETV